MLSLRAPARGLPARAIAGVLILALLAGMLPTDVRASAPTPAAVIAKHAALVVGAADPVSLTQSAFGALLQHTGTDPQPYAFAGEPYDPNAGLAYHRARWMDPRTGRFAAIDTFPGLIDEPFSLHPYLYAYADPVLRLDPSGLFISAGEMTIANGLVGHIGGSQMQFGTDFVLDSMFKDNAAVQMGRVVVNALGAALSLSAVAMAASRSGRLKGYLAKRGLKARKPWGVGDPDALRANMKASGIKPPPYPNAAHHIVAGNAKLAQPAQDHLEMLGITANDAVNGVFLRYTEKGLGVCHTCLHTEKYYTTVNELVLQARSYDEAVEVLQDIAQRLMAGSFPY